MRSERRQGARHSQELMSRLSRIHAAQVDGYEALYLPRLTERNGCNAPNSLSTSIKADIRAGGLRAFYVPAEDYIQKPPFAGFHKGAFPLLGSGARDAGWLRNRITCIIAVQIEITLDLTDKGS